jgi:peptidoglycan-associated lipoprotein
MAGTIRGIGRLACLIVIAGLGLAGCQAVGLQGPETAPAVGTNAPAAGFANMKDGTEGDFILSVGRRTFFAEGSAELDDTAKTTLDKQADWLQRYPQWLLKLQGFADDPGSNQQNVALSKKRAEAVMAYLASRGIERRRMWAKGYGKERIVRDCTDISCTSQNRRVISNLRNERET